MLTGDHLKTATAIAQLVGIIGYDYPKEAVMTGPQFDALSEDEIDNLSQLPRVVARCAPETKVRMVEALHRRKKLCVMTGDGVNDAPSLKRADGKCACFLPNLLRHQLTFMPFLPGSRCCYGIEWIRRCQTERRNCALR